MIFPLRLDLQSPAFNSDNLVIEQLDIVFRGSSTSFSTSISWFSAARSCPADFSSLASGSREGTSFSKLSAVLTDWLLCRSLLVTYIERPNTEAAVSNMAKSFSPTRAETRNIIFLIQQMTPAGQLLKLKASIRLLQLWCHS